MQFVKYQALGNKIVIDFDGDIDRLEGKGKLNQNHPLERREQIMRGPRETGRHNELRIAELMDATRRGADHE